METTRVFDELLAAYVDPAVRVIVLKGGTRSGKTWSVMQLIDLIAIKAKKQRLISVVSETMPHLKRGCIRDFTNILEQEQQWNEQQWNATDKIYKIGKKTIEFFSCDQWDKVLGASRDDLFINECINVPFEVYRQLAVRTAGKIILDYNPAFEFWVDSKVLPRGEEVRLITSTYLDNPKLSAAQIAEIELNRELDPEWWKVYGKGEIGNKEGLIIHNWDIVNALPARASWKKAFIGVDWGWTAPTAIMLVVLGERNEVYIHEIAYKCGLDNPEIAQLIIDAGYRDLEIIADPAEAKSKQELRNAGLTVPDGIIKDINLGIRVMNRYKKHYTAESLNSIDENRKYRYKQDKEGNYSGEPIDKNNHAKDAERYVFLNRLSDVAPSFGYSVISN